MKLRTRALGMFAAAIMFASTATASIIGPFNVDAVGLATQVGNVVTVDATVTSQDPLALDFTDLFGTVMLMGPDVHGDLILFGLSGDLHIHVAGSWFDLGGFTGIAGTFVVTGGTGQFSGIAGDGAFASLTNNANGVTQVLIGGTLVPGPGAMLIVMTGGLMAGCRRRRAD